MSTVTVRRDGIEVQKAFDRDRFEMPAIVFRIESDRRAPATVRVVERIPEAIPTESVKFHPEFDADAWRATPDKTVEFECDLAPGEHVITLYAVAVTSEAAASHLLGEPGIVVDPEGAVGGSGAAAGAGGAGGDQGRRGDSGTQGRGGAGSSSAEVSGGGDVPGGEHPPRHERQREQRRQQATAPADGKQGASPGSGRETDPGSGQGPPPGDAGASPRGHDVGGAPGPGVPPRKTSPGSALVPGAVAGALAFLVGYAVTYALKAESLLGEFRDQELLYVDSPEATEGIDPAYVAEQGLSTPGKRELASWLYHDLHQVGFDGTYALSSAQRDVSYGIVMKHSPDAVLLAVPPLVLVAAGFLVAGNVDVGGPGDTGVTAAAVGATVAVGYALLAAASALFLAWDASMSVSQGGETATLSASFGPELATAVGLAGLAYPLVFGGVGGLLALATGE